MALVEASRSSELQALDLRFRVYKPEGVTFRIPSLTKKRVTGAPPKEFFFASFPANSVICPVHCLRNYELKDCSVSEDRSGSSPSILCILYQTPQAGHLTTHSTLDKRPLGSGRHWHICVQSTFCERWIYNSGFKQGGCFGRYSASGRLEFWHNFPPVLSPSDVFHLFWERSSKSGQLSWQTMSSLSTNTPINIQL